MQFDNPKTVFTKVLKLGSILILTIAVLGGVIGFFAAGLPGLFGALTGAGIALIFVTLTALSVLIGGKMNLGGFYAVVLGGWLLKVVIFIAMIAVLKRIEGLNGIALFATLVASVLGSLAVDGFVVTKSKIPVVS
ncbi:MAG: hypothetical protein RIS26_1117 [Actinomycetota bacterium]|jgi:hypothetical protein